MGKNHRGENEGRYIYCIIGSGREGSFGPMGIGGQGDDVYTIFYGDISAVVSNTPVTKYPVTRNNTMAHQLVMEEVMKECTVLPVRFSTIAEGRDRASPEERIKEKVLKGRYEEFENLLAQMRGKVELGVKALWNNSKEIFEEIVSENQEIMRLRKRLFHQPASPTQTERIKLGEMVKTALEEKKKREGSRILKALKRVTVGLRENSLFGDRMFLNAAFLVEAKREKEFDEIVTGLIAQNGARVSYKCVGPTPPCNFVDLVIGWDE